MPFYIIEHPTRGILIGWDWDQGFKPHFSYTKSRLEAHRFYTAQSARERARTLPLPKGCSILRFPGAEKMEFVS